jgi:hypothetical protein
LLIRKYLDGRPNRSGRCSDTAASPRFQPSIGKPFRQPISSFTLAVQAPLCRPSPQDSTVTGFVYPATYSTRSRAQTQLPRVFGRGLTDFVSKAQSNPKFWQHDLRPCPDLWDHQRLGDQDSMSQRSTASHPASRSPNDGQKIALPLPPVNLRPPEDERREYPQRHGAASQEHGPSQPSQQIVSQPPAPSYPAMLAGDDRTVGFSRGLGMHTILNPTEPEGDRPSPVLASNTQSPLMSRPISRRGTPIGITRPASGGKRGPSSPLPMAEGPSGKSRKMLIPKSPRSISLGGQVMGLLRSGERVSGQEGPRVYAALPGIGSSEVPPMPTLPAHSQHGYNFPPPVSGPPLSRRASIAAIGPSRLLHSQSANSSPSYSSYSSQPSPAPIYQLGQPLHPTSYFSPSALKGALVEGGVAQATPPGTEGPYMTPLSESILFQGSPSGGHGSNIRMLPISTDLGQMYMPVDVQAGSKGADEKRKRNAGASARFRQRRKQREKESTTSIQKLEQQSKELENKLKETEQDRDFYRLERDRFRDALFRNPATRDVAMQAPPSPRLSRPPPVSLQPLGPMYQALEPDHAQGERPARRRRVESPAEYGYSLPPTPAYQPGSHQGYSMRPETTQPPTMPPMHTETAPGPGMGPMSAHPPITQRPPYEQYPRTGYDRAWPGGPAAAENSSQRK